MRSLSRRTLIKGLAGPMLGAAGAGMLPLGFAEPGSLASAKALRHSVCKWTFRSYELDEFCEIAKGVGIESIELLDIEDRPTLERHGLTNAMVKGVPGHIKDGLNRAENHDRIESFFRRVIPLAAEAGYPNIICFSGNRNGMSDEQGLENCARGLQRFVPLAESHGVTVAMELLNSKHNHPDYMADRTEWGVELCEKLGSENFKLLYDIYHMQIMEGDIIHTIRTHHKYFAHYHTGGVPGRHEIDESQELRYEAIIQAIVDTGYRGFIGQEFIPASDRPIESLRKAVEICTI